ncbi:MAG TPA: GNAT family N-acetyltransferase [Solirubrobacteraceae bacterium]
MTVLLSSLRDDETVLPLASMTFGGSITISVVPMVCSSAKATELLAASYWTLVSCGCSSPDFGSTTGVDAVGAAASFSSVLSPEMPSSIVFSAVSPLSPEPSCSAVASEGSDARPSPSEPRDTIAPASSPAIRRSTSGRAATPDRIAVATPGHLVILDAEDAVVAYASIAMTGIDRSAAPSGVACGSPDPVPALLLGQLSVESRHSGLGVGTALAVQVLATAVELNAKAACRAVVVTALNADARRWWERLGFRTLDPTDETCLDLYLLTSDLEATLRTPTRRGLYGRTLGTPLGAVLSSASLVMGGVVL